MEMNVTRAMKERGEIREWLAKLSRCSAMVDWSSAFLYDLQGCIEACPKGQDRTQTRTERAVAMYGRDCRCCSDVMPEAPPDETEKKREEKRRRDPTSRGANEGRKSAGGNEVGRRVAFEATIAQLRTTALLVETVS